MHSARPRRRSTVRTTCDAHRRIETSRRPPASAFDDHPLARTVVTGWRFESAEVGYEHRTLLFGGPVVFALSGLASMCGNRRARRAAERASAPQWRHLGVIEVLATVDRLLVWHGGSWCSVWYSAITSARQSDDRLELHFVADAPYLLVGDIDAVAEVLWHAIAGGERTTASSAEIGAA